jgi:DNA-binding NarL/FixJ family response regulator
MRTLVADRDPLARRLVRDTLRRAGLTVVGEARAEREVIELTRHYRPEAVVIAHAPPDLDAVRTAPALATHALVLVLTPAADDELALLALRAGAAGCLAKDIDLAALPRALQAMHRGEPAIPRRLATALVERYRALPTDGSGLRPVRSPLTDREWEVLDLLAGGATTVEISDELVLSYETVRSHLKSVYRKLDVSSREQAAQAARRLRECLA